MHMLPEDEPLIQLTAPVTTPRKYPDFAPVPGWIIASRLFARLSWKAKALLTVLYGFASRHQRKAWPSVSTLCHLTGISRSHVGLAKRELVREGVLCFAWAPRRQGGHWVWMAREGPFDFAVDTAGPEFAEYRSTLTRAQTVAAPGYRKCPNPPTNGDRQPAISCVQYTDGRASPHRAAEQRSEHDT